MTRHDQGSAGARNADIVNRASETGPRRLATIPIEEAHLAPFGSHDACAVVELAERRNPALGLEDPRGIA